MEAGKVPLGRGEDLESSIPLSSVPDPSLELYRVECQDPGIGEVVPLS